MGAFINTFQVKKFTMKIGDDLLKDLF